LHLYIPLILADFYSAKAMKRNKRKPTMPHVTIGVPVFNGAAQIGDCLQHLSAQTFRDFEVVISDNASTDGTDDICEEFTRRDPRFRMVRQESTSSAIQNFLTVRREARSPLFMWRAFDDLSTPNFIEALVAVHQAHPGISLAAPGILQRFGSAKGDRRLPYIEAPAAPRVAVLLQRMRRMHAAWFYGLWRLEAAERATEDVYLHFPDGWAADYLALFHAALNGGIAGTNACDFYQQILPEVRGYMPRPKPDFSQMLDRNRRFSATCHKFIDGADLGGVERVALRAYLPFFTNRCSHRAKRVLQAAARRLRGS
jgi:glycosyltransferase involved in cell wall biosynthesis